MYDIEKPISYIPLGNQRDFGHTVQFDLTAWAGLNADNWKITYMRPGEAPDPVADWIIDANSTLNSLKSIRFTVNNDGELEVNI